MKNETWITSGIYKGRKLRTPGGATHPMGAREKLALFNMITEYLPGATVLDAYAGSGALGIEALSRGAASAVFVEKDARAAKIIRENLRNLNLEAEVWQKDATKIENASFDIVIADPPYDKYSPEIVLKMAELTNDGGILVVSTPETPPEVPNLRLLTTRKYAGAHISVYLR